MPCYHPWDGYYHRDVNPSGKRNITSNPAQALAPDCPLKMPCGRCIGCRLRYSAMWACRCYHEASLWPRNAMLTLTLSEDGLARRDREYCESGIEPPGVGSLSVRDCQLFMKRYRRELEYVGGPKIRMAYCGEYGDQKGRPHYHFLIFNHDFEDKYFWTNRNGLPVWRSPTLEKLWPYGNSEIGSLTYESAAYVARYITKKLHGQAAIDAYWLIDKETGELLNEKTKEFFKMSRRPGIGRAWLDKFASDVYPSDQVVVISGEKIKIFQPPKYYDAQFEIVDPYVMDEVKERRVLRGRSAKALANSTYDRLLVRETVKLSQLETLTRRYENGSEDVYSA